MRSRVNIGFSKTHLLKGNDSSCAMAANRRLAYDRRTKVDSWTPSFRHTFPSAVQYI